MLVLVECVSFGSSNAVGSALYNSSHDASSILSGDSPFIVVDLINYVSLQSVPDLFAPDFNDSNHLTRFPVMINKLISVVN